MGLGLELLPIEHAPSVRGTRISDYVVVSSFWKFVILGLV